MCTYNANHRTGLTSYYLFIYFVFVYFLMRRHVRKLQNLPVKKYRRSEKENRTFNPREMRITFERPSKERNACSFLKKILERTHTKICLSLRTLFTFPASQVVFSETAAQDGCTTLDILVKFFLARRSKSAWVIGWRVITGPPVFFLFPAGFCPCDLRRIFCSWHVWPGSEQPRSDVQRRHSIWVAMNDLKNELRVAGFVFCFSCFRYFRNTAFQYDEADSRATTVFLLRRPRHRCQVDGVNCGFTERKSNLLRSDSSEYWFVWQENHPFLVWLSRK